MEPDLTGVLDTNKLILFYRRLGFCISYRQIREWVKSGILHPEGGSFKKKHFSPSDVAWAGRAFLLRMAGKKLDSIKEMRLAVDSKRSNKQNQARGSAAELVSLFGKQRDAIQLLTKGLGSTDEERGVIRRPDEIIIKDGRVIIAEYKNSEITKPVEEVQMKFYKKAVESKLKKVKVKCEVRSIREKRGLSQIELAKVLGFSQARLSQIENGWRMPDDTEKSTMAGVLKEKVSTLFPN
jgi:DNA-binding transcriptional regulator YiaG